MCGCSNDFTPYRALTLCHPHKPSVPKPTSLLALNTTGSSSRFWKGCKRSQTVLARLGTSPDSERRLCLGKFKFWRLACVRAMRKYVYVYIYIYIYTYAHIYICVCVCVACAGRMFQLALCVVIWVHPRVCLYACMYVCMYACMYVCTHVRIYVCVILCVRMYARMCVYVRAFPCRQVGG